MSQGTKEMIRRLRSQMSPFFHRVADKLEAAEELAEVVGETVVVTDESHPDFSGAVAVMPESQWDPVFEAFKRYREVGAIK